MTHQVLQVELPWRARVLVVGAGTGMELVTLGAANPGWPFVAVDTSDQMLAICARTVAEAGLGARVALRLGSVDTLPARSRFDAATALLVSHFIADLEQRREFFRSIAGRLRLGAPLVTADLAADREDPSFGAFVKAWKRGYAAAGIARKEVREDFERSMRGLLPARGPGSGLARRGRLHETPDVLPHLAFLRLGLPPGRVMGDPEVRRGYLPGAIGRIVELHGAYYAKHWGFGAFFEARMARELAAFVDRYDAARDALWTVAAAGRVQGSIAIEGSRSGDRSAHLRWFIVDGSLRGHGVGGRLLAEALDFCSRSRLDSVALWTFAGLDAARHLYERAGFRLAGERRGTQWGTEVVEQRFELRLDS